MTGIPGLLGMANRTGTCFQGAPSFLEYAVRVSGSWNGGGMERNLTVSSVDSSIPAAVVETGKNLGYEIRDRQGKLIVRVFKEVPYMRIFEWEKMDFTESRQLIEDYWMMSILASVCYLALVFYGKYWMRNRKAMGLRGPLAVWNILLAVFSFAGFSRTLPELLVTLQEENGFHKSLCSNKDGYNSATVFWAVLMVWSKLFELGDTSFIVLKKQPLIFLHWYHHVTVLVYVWGTFPTIAPSTRYFMTINMFVHAIMYGYYALRAMRVNVSRKISMAITVTQCSQMVLGVYINMYLLFATRRGNGSCPSANQNEIHAALSMYATYLILFTNFFYQAYFGKRKKTN